LYQQFFRETSMPNSLNRPLFLIAGLIAASNLAHANQPPDVVQSDVFQDTAMGTNALLQQAVGGGNTAVGWDALMQTRGGSTHRSRREVRDL
jgi:hypothetical protein